jgi:hypothetical protein
MITINIALVLLGITIPLGTAIFWSKVGKMLNRGVKNKSSGGTILDANPVHNLLKWLHHHKSKFNILVGTIVTIIEFLALMQF